MKSKFFAIAAMIFMAAGMAFGQTVTTGQQQSAVVERPTQKVGNKWTYRVTDGRSGVVTAEENWEVLEVSGDRVVLDFKTSAGVGGKMLESLDSNIFEKIPETGKGYRFSPSSGWLAFPLSVGKTYEVKNKYETEDGYRGSQDMTAKVIGWEQVTVPAGTFSALKIILDGFYESHEIVGVKNGTGRIDITIWYDLNKLRVIKREYKSTYWGGRSVNSWNKTELVAYKLVP